MLYFPKQLYVTCVKLNLAYAVIMFTTVICLLNDFFSNRHYLKLLVAGPNEVKILMEVTGHLDEDRIDQGFFTTRVNSSLCASPEDYDFWNSRMRYENHTCMPPCSTQSTARCMAPYQLFQMENIDQIFMYTYLHEMIRYQNGTRSDDFFFLAHTEMLSLSIKYEFDVVDTSSRILGILDPQIQHMQGDSQTDVLTVLLDNNNNPQRTIQPTSSIDVSIAEVMSYTGASDWLDQIHSEAGANAKPGARYPEGALGRLTGAHFELRLSCHNWKKFRWDDGVTWDGPVCYIQFSKGATWATADKEFYLDSSTVLHQFYHGVRIVAVGTAGFMVVDYNTAYLNLVSAFVILTNLPKTVVMLFVIFCLGRLSEIYRAAVYERFSIRERVCSAAVRLMADSMVYSQLQDAASGISIQTMTAAFKRAFKYRRDRLDESELLGMSCFCFKSICESKRFRHMSVTNCLMDIFPCKIKGITEDLDGHIDIDAFSVSVSSSHAMSFDSMVHLFDQDRFVCLFERIFTPAYIASCIRDISKLKTVGTENERDFAELRRPDTPDHVKGVRAHTHSVNVDLVPISGSKDTCVGLQSFAPPAFDDTEEGGNGTASRSCETQTDFALPREHGHKPDDGHALDGLELRVREMADTLKRHVDIEHVLRVEFNETWRLFRSQLTETQQRCYQLEAKLSRLQCKLHGGGLQASTGAPCSSQAAAGQPAKTTSPVRSEASPPARPPASNGQRPRLLEPWTDEVAFADPRGGHEERASVVGFSFPGRAEECDILCGAAFLGNSWDVGSDGIEVEARCPSAAAAETRPFSNAEAAFQALRYWGEADRFRTASGGEAVKLARELQGKEDWSYGGYGSSWLGMFAVLRAKFARGGSCMDALLRTGDAYLLLHRGVLEGDRVWSNHGYGDGTNWLGLQLMLIRDELRPHSRGHRTWTAYIRDECRIDPSTGRPADGASNGAWQRTVQSATRALVSKLGEDRGRTAGGRSASSTSPPRCGVPTPPCSPSDGAALDSPRGFAEADWQVPVSESELAGARVPPGPGLGRGSPGRPRAGGGRARRSPPRPRQSGPSGGDVHL